MIIGTAGHIDHGKTSLVRVLTGVDGDRLKEEKSRGITIDIGFAYMPGRDGEVIGFVGSTGRSTGAFGERRAVLAPSLAGPPLALPRSA